VNESIYNLLVEVYFPVAISGTLIPVTMYKEGSLNIKKYENIREPYFDHQEGFCAVWG